MESALFYGYLDDENDQHPEHKGALPIKQVKRLRLMAHTFLSFA